MRFYDANFPLIVGISDAEFDDDEVRRVTSGFEAYFERGEKYALLWVQTESGRSPGLRARASIGSWIAHPRVRDFTKRLCVGAVAVVPNAIIRGALSGIMMIAKPPTPFSVAPSAADGLDLAFEYLVGAGLSLPKSQGLVKREALEAIG